MNYRERLAAAQQNPQEADFHALRMAYTRSPEYAPYNQDSVRIQALGHALRDGDLGAALEAALTLLDQNYLDIEAHMAADYVYTQLGDEAESAYHRAFARGLIAAILATGDGRGTATAFIVISVPEEHTVLRVLRLRMQQQRLMEHEGRWYDVISTQHPASGEPMDVYFDVHIPRAWLSGHVEEAFAPDSSVQDAGDEPPEAASGDAPESGDAVD